MIDREYRNRNKDFKYPYSPKEQAERTMQTQRAYKDRKKRRSAK
jgi:hypothetical protein